MAEPTSMQFDGAPATLALSDTRAETATLGAANAGQPDLYATYRLCSDQDAWMAIGTAPEATAAANGSFLLPTGAVEYVDILAGHKISAVLVAGTGTLSLSRMKKL